MDEHVNCNAEIARLRAGIRDAESALRNARATLRNGRRQWAQGILIIAEEQDWDDAEIAAHLAGIASAVSVA